MVFFNLPFSAIIRGHNPERELTHYGLKEVKTMLNRWMKNHNGSRVTLDGHSHKVQYNEYTGYDGRLFTEISLVPINKNSRYYQDMKNYLGDDWSTDFKSLSDDHFVDVCVQLGITVQDMQE